MNFSTLFRTFIKKSSSVQPTPSSVRKNFNKNGNPQNEGERLAKLYRIIKGTQAPTFTDIEIDYPKPLQSIQVKHPQEMICSQAYLLSLINQQLGMKEEAFVKNVLTTVENYAAWVQLLPASESYHHTAIGGLFAHSLDVSLRALKIFENRNVYVEGTALEREGALTKFRLAAFLGGLLHDVGKIFEDITVTAPDGRVWCSQVEPLYTWALKNNITKYQYVWRKGRHLESHELYTAYYLPRIVPQDVFRWLSETEPNVSKVLIGALSNNSDGSYGRIWDIVQKADSSSTKADVDLHGSTDKGREYEVPVGMYFCKGVNELLQSNTWSVNTPTSEVYVFDSGVFIIWSRRTFDALMAFFDREGYTGIPHQSFTLAQLIAESTVAVTNSIYPADSKQDPEPYPLWRVKLDGPTGPCEHLAIRVKQAARIFEASNIPFPIHGEILDITPDDLVSKQNFIWDKEAQAAKNPEPSVESKQKTKEKSNAEDRVEKPEQQTNVENGLRRVREPRIVRKVSQEKEKEEDLHCNNSGTSETVEEDNKTNILLGATDSDSVRATDVHSCQKKKKEHEEDDNFVEEQAQWDESMTVKAAAEKQESAAKTVQNGKTDASSMEIDSAKANENDDEHDTSVVGDGETAETSDSNYSESKADEDSDSSEEGGLSDPYAVDEVEDEKLIDEQSFNEVPTKSLIERETPAKNQASNPRRLLSELRDPGPISTTLILTHPCMKTMCRTLRSHEVFSGPVAQLLFELGIALSVGRISVMWIQKSSVIPERIRNAVSSSMLVDTPDAVKVFLPSEDAVANDAKGSVYRLNALLDLFPGRLAALSQAVDRLKDAGYAEIVTIEEGQSEFRQKSCFSVKPLVERAMSDKVKNKPSPDGVRLKSYAHLALMSVTADFDRAVEDDGPYLLTEGTVRLLNEVCSKVSESTFEEGLARPSNANPEAERDESDFRRTYFGDDRRTAVSPRFEDVFCILRDQIRSGGGNWTVNLKLTEGGAVLSVDTFENIVRDFPEFTPIALSDYVFSGSAAHLGFSSRGNRIFFSEENKK